MKYLILILSVLLISASGLTQKRTFLGKVTYELMKQSNSRLTEGARIVYNFSDSTIRLEYSDSSYQVTYLYKNVIDLFLRTRDKTLKSIPVESKGFVYGQGLLKDSLVILNLACDKAVCNYRIETPLVSETSYELYLSPYYFNCPDSYTSFDPYFKNGFGRIPLKIRQVNFSSNNNKSSEFEWTAVRIENN